MSVALAGDDVETEEDLPMFDDSFHFRVKNLSDSNVPGNYQEMEVSVLVLVEGGGRDMMVTSGIVEIVSRLVEIVVQVVAGCWTRLGPGLTRPDLIHHQGTFSHFLSISFLRPEVVRTKFFTDTRLGTLGLGFDRLLMFDGTRTRWILDGMRSLILQEVRAVRSGDLLSLGWN